MYVLVSGIPASGKSTISIEVAAKLQFPLFDKDIILESLFETLGTGDTNHRKKLSRVSDAILRDLVLNQGKALICSFWRHHSMGVDSGTPVDWLLSSRKNIVELHCRCEPQLAVTRFLNRKRHPGHLDKDRTESELLAQFQTLAGLGPLNCGPLIEIDMESTINTDELSNRIRDVFNA